MSKSKLIKKWSMGGKDYRLLDLGRGYSAKRYLSVERDDKDTLGDPKWVEVHSWTENGHDRTRQDEAIDALVTLVEESLAALEIAKRASANTKLDPAVALTPPFIGDPSKVT